MNKIPAKQLERMMLHDAIQWQVGLVDAVRGTEDYEDASSLLKQYRALFKRRYGAPQTHLDAMLEGAVLVDVLSIRSVKDDDE